MVNPPVLRASSLFTSAPAWFLGSPHRWHELHSAFDRAAQMDRQGAQHTLVGAMILIVGALLAQRWVTVPMLGFDGALFGWSLMASAFLAMALGRSKRNSAMHRMTLAFLSGVADSRNTTVILPTMTSETERTVTLNQAREGRAHSAPDSFGDLMNVMVEARARGDQKLVMKVRWVGGVTFIAMKPLISTPL